MNHTTNENEEPIDNQSATGELVEVSSTPVAANNELTTNIKLEENTTTTSSQQLLTSIANQTGLISSRTRNKKLNDANTKQQQHQSNQVNPKPSSKKTILSYLTESENLRRKQQEELQQQDSSTHKENTLKSGPDSLNNSTSQPDSVSRKNTNATNSNNKSRRNSKNNSRATNKRSSQEKKSIRKRPSVSESSKDSGSSLKRSASSGSNGLANQLTGTNASVNQNKFTKNALFHSPTSILTKFDLKTLFQPTVFESLPKQFQLKVIKLLPECDRQVDSTGSFK